MLVETVGACKTCRARTDYGHPFSGTCRRYAWLHHSFEESALYDCGFVLTYCYRLMLLVEHASFLAQGRAYTSGKFGKVISGCEQTVCSAYVVFVKTVLPFWLLVTQRAAPMAERYSTFHAARCLQAAILRIESLLYLSVILYSVVDGPVAGLFTRYC